MTYVLLISQITVNTLHFCHWMIDSEKEVIELTNSAEDAEQEEDNKKELHNKLRIQAHHLDIQIAFLRCLHAQDLMSLHHPEITTPPPKLIKA